MRRLIVFVVALLIIVSLPASASAARPTQDSDHAVSLWCDGMVATEGGAFAYFGATMSDVSGEDAILDVWNAGVPSGPPEMFREYDQPLVLTWNGTIFAGTIPLRTIGGSADEATFSAVLTPAGDPIAFDETLRDGNHRTRFTGTSQAFQPTGSLTLPSGAVFDLAACHGDETFVTTTRTNPTAYTSRFSSRFVGCGLSNAAGDSGYLYMDLGDEGGFIDAGLFSAGGSPNLGAFGFFDPTSVNVDTDLTLYDFDGPGAVSETGHLTVTLTATGESFINILKNATGRRVTRGELIDLEGTLTIAGSSFDLDACVGQDSSTKQITTFPHGPKPGGKVPSNDLPSGAALLRPVSSTTIQTRGASSTAEARFECLEFTDPGSGDVFATPVGNTVWYRFVGTGGEMTIDTARSDFDTVVATYTADGSGSYIPVSGGCVDDSPTPPIGRTLQASVTIPTVAGTTYYAQIGGFPESFPYGNLRVSLR